MSYRSLVFFYEEQLSNVWIKQKKGLRRHQIDYLQIIDDYYIYSFIKGMGNQCVKSFCKMIGIVQKRKGQLTQQMVQETTRQMVGHAREYISQIKPQVPVHPNRSVLKSSYYSQKLLNDEQLIEVLGFKMKGVHRWVGALKWITGSVSYAFGSAVLISKNLVLTAAHNLFDHSNKDKKPKDFKLYMGACGPVDKFFTIQDDCWRFPTQFLTKKLSQYDYAIMKLSEDHPEQPELKAQNKFLALSIVCLQCQIESLKQSQMEIFGYPYQYDENGPVIQYGSKKQRPQIMVNPKTGRICYDISTQQGHSGSPVVTKNNIIGVHIGSGKDHENFNVGRLITFDVMENLIKWGKQLDGDPFTINHKDHCQHTLSKGSDQMFAPFLRADPSRQIASSNIFKPIPVQMKPVQQLNNPKVPQQKRQPDTGPQLEKTKSLQIVRPQQNQKQPVLKDKQPQNQQIKRIAQEIQADILLNQKKVLIQEKRQNIEGQKQSRIMQEPKFLQPLQQIYRTQTIGNQNSQQIKFYDNSKYFTKNINVTFDVSKFKNIKQLVLKTHNIFHIDLGNNQELTHLNLEYNKLVSIDLSQNKKLKILQLALNKITQINLTSNSSLTDLSLPSNKLNTINLQKQSKLRYLNFHNNQLEAVNLKENPNIEYLNLSFNNIKIINLTKNQNINRLYLNQNNLRLIRFWFWSELSLKKEKKKQQHSLQLGNQKQINCDVTVLYHEKSAHQDICEINASLI